MGELKTITPESLGRLAAHHELLAADPSNMPMEREHFLERADFYRSRQYEMLAPKPDRDYPRSMDLAPAPNVSHRKHNSLTGSFWWLMFELGLLVGVILTRIL